MITDGYANTIIKQLDTLDALIQNSNGFKLEPTIVKVESFYNPAKDLKETVYIVDKKLKPIALFKNHKFKKNSIVGKYLKYSFLEPNSVIDFNINDKKILIKATGDIIDEKSFKTINDYEILVVDSEIEYSLIKVPSAQWTNKNFIEAPHIIWFGDLDNDNKLDFIIDESTHYASIMRALYLSSNIQDRKYVRSILIEDSVD